MVLVKLLVPTFVSLIAIGQIEVVRSSSCVSRYSPKTSGSCIQPSQCTGAALPGLCTNSPGTVCCVPSQHNSSLITSNNTATKNTGVTRSTFYKMFGRTRRSSSMYPYYVKALDDAGISTLEQIAVFTAQILYETSNLTVTEEDSDGLQYEGSASLGNNQPGDGPRYRGRGVIPIRGRHMYKVLAGGIGQDLEDAPESAALPSIAFEIAAWLWKNGYQSPVNTSSSNTGPLKHFATSSKYGFAMMSHAITQSNKKVTRTTFPKWLSVIKILNATCPREGSGPKCTTSDGHQGVCKLAPACKTRSVENLCDGPPDIECCIACNNPLDLVFVVDSSGSVGANNFKLMMDFISDVSSNFYLSASNKDGTQIALVRFSSTSEILFDFKKYRDHADVTQALRKVRYTSGGTNTVRALKSALDDLFRNPASGIRPKSSGVSRILILLTDGKTSDDIDVVREPADALRREGVDIFVIGISKGVKLSELIVIASDPPEHHLFLSDTFRALKQILPEIQVVSCNEPALLEAGATVSIEVKQKQKKFFKYKNAQLEEIAILIFNQTSGMVDVQLSFTNKNPTRDVFASCDAKDNFITDMSEFDGFTNETFCSLNPGGGIFLPTGKDVKREPKVAYIKMCSRQNVYVGVKGLSSLGFLDISLLNFSNTHISTAAFISNGTEHDFSSKNASEPIIPLQFSVYVGCTVAGFGALATIAAYLALSFSGKSAEMAMMGSTASQTTKVTMTKKRKKSGKDDDSDSDEDNTPKTVMISNAHLRFQGVIRRVLLLLSVINAIKRGPKTRFCDNEEKKTTGLTSDSRAKPVAKSQARGELNDELVENKEALAVSVQTVGQKKKEDCQEPIPSWKDSLPESKAIFDNNLSFMDSSSIRGTPSLLSGNVIAKEQSFINGKNKNPSANGTVNDQGNTIGNMAPGTMFESVTRDSSKRQRAAMFLPCFTLCVANDGEAEKTGSQAREERFENDMHVSQAFCVVAIQAIFMSLTRARKNETTCTAAAISVNYLYLVAMVWLLIEAYHLYRMMRSREKHASRPDHFNGRIFYVFAWGFPLVVVPVMMIKHKRYILNPHCWISMANILDLAVSVPFFAIASAQLIILGLLFIALYTYENPTNNEKKKLQKDKLKSVIYHIS